MNGRLEAYHADRERPSTDEEARACAVIVMSSLDEPPVAAILGDLELQRGWRSGSAAVIVWQLGDAAAATSEPTREAEGTLAAPPCGFRSLQDGEPLVRGGRYFVPAQRRVWFEGKQVRLGSRAPGEHRPVDRFLLSLAEGWGSEGAAVLPSAVDDDGECGLRIIHAVGGVAQRRSLAAATPAARPAAAPSPGAEPQAPVAPTVHRASATPRASASGQLPGAARDSRTARVFSIPSQLVVARAACEAAIRRGEESGRVRIWQPGCKSGGLTYALAMLLCEAARHSSSPPKLLVYGTDTDIAALAVARGGRYPARAALGMDPTLRGLYTFDEGETIRASEALREICVFASHDFGRDMPMARMDLVICHGVFDGASELEKSAMVEAFYYAVRDGGLLLAFDHIGSFPEDRFERVEGGYLQARRDVPSRRWREREAKPPSSPQLPLPLPAPPPRGAVGASSLEHALPALGLPVIVCDQQLRVRSSSPEADAAFSLSDAVRGLELAAITAHLPGGAELLSAAQRALSRRKPEELMIRTGQQAYLARLSAAGDAAFVTIAFIDVTQLERAKARAVAQRHQQAAIARLSELALGTVEASGLYEEALASLFGHVHACAAGIIVERGQRAGAFSVAASRGLGADPLATLRRLRDSAALLDAVVERGCVVSQTAERAAWGAAPAPGLRRPRSRQHPLSSSLARGVGCPIFSDGKVLGVIALYGRRAGIDDPEHQPFLRAVANVLGAAIARQRTRRRLSLELEVSRVLAGASRLDTLGDGLRPALAGALGADEIELWVSSDAGSQRWIRLWSSPQQPGVERPPWLSTVVAGTGAVPFSSGDRCELCLPLQPRDGPQCVLVLRGAALREPDAELAEGLQSVGRMLEAFLERLEILAVSRQNEISYRQKTAELEALYASLPVGVSIHDYRGRIRHFNRHLAALEPSASVPATHPLKRLYAEEIPSWVERVTQLGEPVHDVELGVLDGERSHSWLCNFAPIRDVEGRLHGASVVVQDITSFKRVEASLREADHQKDDFLAMLGHELRNPIAAIRSATELLGRVEAATPQVQRLHGIFERQTQQTTKLIDGLLDVARVARGKIELELGPVPIARLLRQVIDDHQQQFGERSIDCRLPDDELWVQADRARLMQVIDNLLSNSLKFTAANGRIGIALSQGGGRGVLQVDDDGAGIESELLPYIFEPFRQGRPKSAGQAGLGLGLALVKGLIDLHGFELSAASEGRGRGASFRIEFPLVAAPDSPPPPSRVDTRPLDLLLVEDNRDIVETLAELLISAGHQVQWLSTAEEALGVLHERRPDVVLCDIGLPGMSGLELATRVRAEPELAAVKLVAMTGYGDASTQGRIARAGFDRTLIKPVQLEALRHCLARVVAAAPTSRPELESAGPSGARGTARSGHQSTSTGVDADGATSWTRSR